MKERLWFDKYCPIRLLAADDEREVFLCEHVLLKELRIIKRVNKNSKRLLELKREAEILNRLNHPCFPRLLDVEEDSVYFCMVQEYMEGETLSEYLERCGHIRPEEVLEYSVQLGGLLVYLHQTSAGVIHCDLHPGNLILSEGRIKLIDFGAALLSGEGGLSSDSYGSREFSAPEQFEKGIRDERTDIYAAGCLIHYMLEYAKETRGSVRKRKADAVLLGKLDNIARECRADIPGKRYRYAEELTKELAGLSERHHNRKEELPEDRRVRTIGVAGLHRAAGVTHTALLLANYLCTVCHKKVAVIELSGHGDLRCFAPEEDYSTAPPCRIHGIDLYPDADGLLAGALRNGKYDYCILDLGCRLMQKEQELFRCDCKLLLTGSAVWHRESKTAAAALEKKLGCFESWWILLNFSLPSALGAWRSASMRADCLDYSPGMFSVTEQNNRLFRKILATF